MKRLEWGDIIGHRENVKRLRAFIQREKMPHALLFVGPEGIGKFLVARTAAAALFCSGEERPCGACSSCRAFLLENHPDFSVVEPDGQAVKIEQIRALQKDASLAPCLSDERIIILKSADKMTLPAANSLLKTLEEPAGNTVFILLAENRQMLLDTILSRCMTMIFQPLAPEDIAAALLREGLAENEAETLARLAGGSLSKALQMKEHEGLRLRGEAADLLCSAAAAPLESVWRTGEKIGAMERGEMQELLLFFNLLLRDALILQYGGSSRLLYNLDLREKLAEISAAWPPRKIFFAFQEILNMQKMMKANGNLRLMIEQFMIKMREK